MGNDTEPKPRITEQVEASETEIDYLMRQFIPSSCASFTTTMLGLEPYARFAQLRPAARSHQMEGVRQHGVATGERPHDEGCIYLRMKFIVSS